MTQIVLLRLPSRYMREDATEDQKEVFEYYKRCIKEIQEGSRSGLIMPSDRDPETRQPLFDIEIKGV